MPDEPIPMMQQLIDNPFLLLFLGVATPTVLYIVWGVMEIVGIPLAKWLREDMHDWARSTLDDLGADLVVMPHADVVPLGMSVDEFLRLSVPDIDPAMPAEAYAGFGHAAVVPLPAKAEAAPAAGN